MDSIMSNKETASANSMEEVMALMGVEDEHNEGGTTSGGGGVEDKIEIKIEEDEDKEKDEESKDEEEVEAEYQNLVKKVLDDYIDVSTRYGYRLNQRRILEFLYAKSKIVSKKKGKIAAVEAVEARKLLHDDRRGCLG
jgi:predicted RNA-binding protein Jag